MQRYEQQLLIGGDINISETNNRFKDYSDLINSCGFERSNNAVTFNYFNFIKHDEPNGSILDNVLIPNFINNVTLTSPKTAFSDHNILIGTAISDV
jgi:hypothetical protein